MVKRRKNNKSRRRKKGGAWPLENDKNCFLEDDEAGISIEKPSEKVKLWNQYKLDNNIKSVECDENGDFENYINNDDIKGDDEIIQTRIEEFLTEKPKGAIEEEKKAEEEKRRVAGEKEMNETVQQGVERVTQYAGRRRSRKTRRKTRRGGKRRLYRVKAVKAWLKRTKRRRKKRKTKKKKKRKRRRTRR